MLNKINQLMQWTINKLIKILTVVIFILGSTQSSAAWFVSDIALTDLAATLVSSLTYGSTCTLFAPWLILDFLLSFLGDVLEFE